MSESKINKTRVQPEIHKYPFEHTFTCPKCKEILLININYSGKTIIPQVHYTCPKKHSGNVDLPLFFNLFHSSNQEIEEDLSKFDEMLEKDIEIFKKKNLSERKLLDPINFSEMINKKNKDRNKEEINKEKSQLLFNKIQKCNEIGFSLTNKNIINNINIKKKLLINNKERPLAKSESKPKEKIKTNFSKEKSIKILNKSNKNKNNFSPKKKANNINIIKKVKEKPKKKEIKIEEEKKEKKEEKKSKKC